MPLIQWVLQNLPAGGGTTAYVRGVSESWAWTESSSRSSTFSRAQSESWTWTETAARVAAFVRSEPESWTWTEAMSRAAAYSRSTPENWSVSESVSRSVASGRSASETWTTWSESGSRSSASSRGASETWTTWSESGSSVYTPGSGTAYVRGVSESWAWVETLSSNLQRAVASWFKVAHEQQTSLDTVAIQTEHLAVSEPRTATISKETRELPVYGEHYVLNVARDDRTDTVEQEP